MTSTANKHIVLNRFKDFTEKRDFLEDIPPWPEKRGKGQSTLSHKHKPNLVFITTICKHSQRSTAGEEGGRYE